MSNVFIFTGDAIEEADFLKDHYLQLILIQYSIKSLTLQIEDLEINFASKKNIISCDLKIQWLNELKTLRTVHVFLSEWFRQLNENCPNPDDSPNEKQKTHTH